MSGTDNKYKILSAEEQEEQLRKALQEAGVSEEKASAAAAEVAAGAKAGNETGGQSFYYNYQKEQHDKLPWYEKISDGLAAKNILSPTEQDELIQSSRNISSATPGSADVVVTPGVSAEIKKVLDNKKAATKKTPLKSIDEIRNAIMENAQDSGESSITIDPNNASVTDWLIASKYGSDTKSHLSGGMASSAWLSPKYASQSKLLFRSGVTDTTNLSNILGYSKDAATNHKDASDMSAEDLLKSYFNKTFSQESYESPYQEQIAEVLGRIESQGEYAGLGDAEKKEAEDYLRDLANDTEKDTMGKYASMTGGIPSTAAVQMAAKSGADVMSQLQDILSEKDQTKYNRYRNELSDNWNELSSLLSQDETAYNRYNDERSLAYDNLYKLMSLYGYNNDQKSTTGTTSGSSTSSGGSSTSSGQTFVGSLSTAFNSPSMLNQFASAAGVDPTTLSSYSSWIKSYGENLAGDGVEDVDSGTLLKDLGAAALIKKLDAEFPDDAPFRMAAIIDYLYDNAYITGTERNQWLISSGLTNFFKELTGESITTE